MSRTKVIMLTLVSLSACGLLLFRQPVLHANAAAQGESAAKTPLEAGQNASLAGQSLNSSRAAREEKALQDARRQQLADKEAALSAKEQELKKLSAKLEAQVKALEESKKRLDDKLKIQSDEKKKKQDEKMQKMVKLFKAMRGEQAGKMIDNLQEDLALSLLSRLDTKTVAKLAPFINQPRVIKWITENLQKR